VSDGTVGAKALHKEDSALSFSPLAAAASGDEQRGKS